MIEWNNDRMNETMREESVSLTPIEITKIMSKAKSSTHIKLH